MRHCTILHCAIHWTSLSFINQLPHQVQADQLRQRFGGGADVLQEDVADRMIVVNCQVAQAAQRRQVRAEECDALPKTLCCCSWVRVAVLVWRQHELRESSGQAAHPSWQRDLQSASKPESVFFPHCHPRQGWSVCSWLWLCTYGNVLGTDQSFPHENMNGKASTSMSATASLQRYIGANWPPVGTCRASSPVRVLSWCGSSGCSRLGGRQPPRR